MAFTLQVIFTAPSNQATIYYYMTNVLIYFLFGTLIIIQHCIFMTKLKSDTLDEVLLKYSANNSTALIFTIFALKSLLIMSFVYLNFKENYDLVVDIDDQSLFVYLLGSIWIMIFTTVFVDIVPKTLMMIILEDMCEVKDSLTSKISVSETEHSILLANS
mmetsp:Transcript_29217/g.52198  ORF Transcript_29217/g.52198 Transcript_29217/m.52198 type:complete len:160 (+) Transcript_29217:378-857(+)